MRSSMRIAAVAVTAAVIAAGGGAAAGGAAVAATPSPHPPCTRAALASGLTRGANPLRHVRLVKPYGCAGRFAFSGAITQGPNGVEITAFFTADGSRWQTANRGRYCRGKATAVPRAIRKDACFTN